MRAPPHCDTCAGADRPPIAREDDAARHSRFISAALPRRTLLGGVLAAAAIALAPSAAAQRAPSRSPGPGLQSEARVRQRLAPRRGAHRGPPMTCEAPSPLQWPDCLSERRLALSNVATGESFDGVIWADGCFDDEALARLDALMRDTHADTVAPCDRRLFDLLACVQAHVRRPFHILSGFRTPETNAALARGDPAVAPNSFHIRGMAVDIYVEGVPPVEVAQKAREVGAGGVGAGATFVHLDTGPARSWAY